MTLNGIFELMLITADMIGTAIIGAFVGFGGSYFTYRLTLESRLKDLEHEIQLLEPIRNAVKRWGSEHVDKIFKQGKK